MKRFLLIVSLLLLCCGSAWGAEKIESPEACLLCGMNRTTYAYSRMVIVYDDGASDGLCSLNCAVEQMKKFKTRKVKSLLVADYGSRKLIDARKALWVIGGKIPGVMTPKPKWAFARQADAEAFVKENGGTLSNFDEALKLALQEND